MLNPGFDGSDLLDAFGRVFPSLPDRRHPRACLGRKAGNTIASRRVVRQRPAVPAPVSYPVALRMLPRPLSHDFFNNHQLRLETLRTQGSQPMRSMAVRRRLVDMVAQPFGRPNTLADVANVSGLWIYEAIDKGRFEAIFSCSIKLGIEHFFTSYELVSRIVPRTAIDEISCICLTIAAAMRSASASLRR